MVNGPPTPPPTTATELQDEARGQQFAASSASSSSAPLISPRQDVYQDIFPTIADLAGQNNFEELIRIAERSDLNGDGDRYPSRLLIIAPLVLSYLINDILPPARYALTRLPEALTSLPLTQALLGLLASVWERNHANVYDRAENLFHLAGQPDFLDPELGNVIGGLVTTFVAAFRRRTFILLSKAYTSLPLSLARIYLGLQPDELVTAAEQYQWSFDASTQILSPIPSNPSHNAENSGPSSLSTFHLVADSVAMLEI